MRERERPAMEEAPPTDVLLELIAGRGVLVLVRLPLGSLLHCCPAVELMQVNGILLARVIMQKSLEELKQLAFKGPFVACTQQSALVPLRQLLDLLEEP